MPTFPSYNISDIDDGGDIEYFGYLSKVHEWVIAKIDNINKSCRYTKGRGNYVAAWTSRESLSYYYYDEVF